MNSKLTTALLVVLLCGSVVADNAVPDTDLPSQIRPTIKAVEDLFRGNPTTSIEEVVSKDATFQGLRPLRDMIEKQAKKPAKRFPADSKVYWQRLTDVRDETLRSQLSPDGINPSTTVIVFRDLDSRAEQKFRVIYWLSKIDGRWMIVRCADGWMDTAPLSSTSTELNLSRDTPESGE